MPLRDVLARPGPRKLLALDGGGIRGVMTLEVLESIERILRERTGSAGLVLGDWFDYVAGTSTGAIIAACIAVGMPVKDIRELYEKQGAAMFQKAFLLRRLWYAFESEPLAVELRRLLGADTRLGSDDLRCLLLILVRNATTDSPWPVTNNPAAAFNDRARADCNLDLPLWQLVRASAAAPVLFPPEHVSVGGSDFLFVDGGVSCYNNPAFLLFLMATLEPYRLCWPAGAERMLLVSVGTGLEVTRADGAPGTVPSILENARALPFALMASSAVQQDLLCRAFGRCLAGEPIDSEVGDLVDRRQEARSLPALFTYVRYNAELSVEGFRRIGIHGVDPSPLTDITLFENLPQLKRIGRALAETQVRPSHFDGFA